MGLIYFLKDLYISIPGNPVLFLKRLNFKKDFPLKLTLGGRNQKRKRKKQREKERKKTKNQAAPWGRTYFSFTNLPHAST